MGGNVKFACLTLLSGPVAVGNQSVFFRGAQILNATLKSMAQAGLASSRNLIAACRKMSAYSNSAATWISDFSESELQHCYNSCTWRCSGWRLLRWWLDGVASHGLHPRAVPCDPCGWFATVRLLHGPPELFRKSALHAALPMGL